MSTGEHPLTGSFKIRLALPCDAQALGTVQAESHQLTYAGIMPDAVLARQRPARLIERFTTRLEAAAATAPGDPLHLKRLWVIEADGVAVGYAATEPAANRFLPPPQGAGEMESLYLHPAFVGRGFGRALHRHAIGDLRARGFDPLILWAFAANQAARRFYEQAGWVLDLAGENWVLDGVACPIVRYRLDGARRATGAERESPTHRESASTPSA